jgi:hypothetical protein
LLLASHVAREKFFTTASAQKSMFNTKVHETFWFLNILILIQ